MRHRIPFRRESGDWRLEIRDSSNDPNPDLEPPISNLQSPISTPQSPISDLQSPVQPRHDRLAVALLLALSFAWFADVWIGVGNFYMRDLTRYYYPTKKILREIVYDGEFPYWNRHFSAGQPIAANPEHEVFYPLTWLILLPSYDFGYRLHVLIHILIGLLGMYTLLRSMELRPPAAFFGAVSFGLGGLYLSYINLLPILFCAAWLPLTCLYVRRFLLEKRLRDFALAALFLGMQFLVGEPTTIMQTGFLIGMYALYRAWYSKPRTASAIRNIAIIALISIVAFSVGSAQMVSAIDHVGDSARSRPFDWDLVKAWSMPWAKIAEMIYPNILGHIAVDRVMWYWGGGLYPGMGSPFLFSIYCGLAVTALAVGGAFTRPRGGRFVLILIVFSSIIALGGHTPVLKLLYKAGVATSIRYPEKFILIAIFALIIFAAQMLQRVIDGDQALRDATAGFALATAVVALVIAIAAFTPIYGKVFMKVWGQTAGAGTTKMLALSKIDWIIAAARGGLLVLLLLTVRRRPLWFAGAAAFFVADLAYITYELNPRMPSRFFTEPPPIEKTLPRNRHEYRIFHEIDWYGQEETARKYFSTGEAVYWVVRNGLFPMTPGGSGVSMVIERDYDKTALIPTIDLTDSVWDVKRSGRADWYQPFMAMSNAWFRGIYRDFEVEKKKVRGDMRKALPVQFIETEHYPRYYFADQVVEINDRHDFVNKLKEGSYSSRAAFVVQKGFVPADGVVRSVRETANDATIEVVAGGRAFLVMSVTPHKYWRIYMDGKRVEPVITNIGYQGVIVPSGNHTITMRYRNDIIRVAGPLSASTAAALLLIVVFARRRTRS